MARLISRTQVEEQQDFIKDTSFAQAVTISGSLLVSESFSLGSNPNTKSDITGSVEITGSLTIDGPVNFTSDTELDVTSSLSVESLDTKKFGGISAKDFGANEATLYVSSTTGDDNNDGRTPQFPLKTIKRAAELASAGDDGRFGLPDSDFSGFRIDVAAGTYREDNPIELPKNTTVWGSGLRVSKVIALNETEDLFWVNSGCYLAEMTFGGLRISPSVDDCKSGFAIAFAPNTFITTSPYIQNCSMISNQENSFLELYEDIPPGGGGLNVDGNRIHPDSPLASMVLDAYTQVAPNGVGCQVVGRGFIQLVSFFTNFSAYAVKVLDGGQAVLLNSNTSFGDFGMFSSGSRFITGSGGNIEAFNRVQSNYTIIVDTIEDGLSAIPEFIPNTNDGIKVTNFTQSFLEDGNSSDEVAEQANSEYRLISSIIDTGISNIPPLLAKSTTRGYSTNSVWNISTNEQFTGSITASANDLDKLSDNFSKVTEILSDGNRVTASYTKIDNIDSLLKFGDIPQYSGSDSATLTEVGELDESFNIVLNIVENGLDDEEPITVVSSNINNIKLTETPQFITDINSNDEVINKISSSFATIYRIVNKGSDYSPDIIPSASIENPTIDFQNASSALLGNLEFIQNETIAYISSSWSSETYNQLSYSLDIETFISGTVKDLLFGGNEEIVQIGIDEYNKYANVGYQTKRRILDGIEYINGLSTRLVDDVIYVEPNIDSLNAYDLLINNKEFIQTEVIQYISASWNGFEYDEDKCKRDVGFIVDAVGTDLLYGGNQRSVIAGEFYYEYPSSATTTQLLPTLDSINYAKDLTGKLVLNEIFSSPSSITQSIYDLALVNKDLIQTETVNYIDTQFPNLVYLRDKCKRDTGYILDAVLTDYLYGGNQKSIRAGLYYNEVPSKVNGEQLTETLDGINYSKTFLETVLSNTIIDSPKIIKNTEAKIRATEVEPTISAISGSEIERIKVSSSFGLVEDIIKQGDDSVLAAIAGNSPDISWTTNSPILTTGITQITSSTISSTADIISTSADLFDTFINIIESGSSVTTDITFGSASNSSLPISQVGIPKDSYSENNLTTTVVETILPDDVVVTLNTANHIRFNSGSQYTTQLNTPNELTSSISNSFSTVIDIIEYGITGSEEISGSVNSSSYFEVITLPNDETAFYFTQNQLQYYDGRNGWGLTDGENTGSFEGSIKDPTLTLVRNEMYNFSINDLAKEDESINRPFVIKTKPTPGVIDDVFESEGLNNNGITFGTLTFTPLYDTPDTLYYVNPNNVSASGVINIVDSLPLSDEQEIVTIPSKGNIDKILNASSSLKVTNNTQYTSSINSSINDRNSVSGGFSFIKDILESGSLPSSSIIDNVENLIKQSDVMQYTSSLSSSFDNLNKITESFSTTLSILETNTAPVQIGNTTEFIAVGNVSQFITSSISASISDVSFISESFSITNDIIEFGSSSYESASLYQNEVTESSTVAAYNLLKENADFIQEETILYLSSSYSNVAFNEVSHSTNIEKLVNGIADDLIHNTYSASIVIGNSYPSASSNLELVQTLDGIGYAGRLAQNVVQNILYQSPNQNRLDTELILRENKDFIQEETVAFVSASNSSADYDETIYKETVGLILDSTITDIVYGGNERIINTNLFYLDNSTQFTNVVSQSILSGIEYAGGLSKQIAKGEIFSQPTDDKLNSFTLLKNNSEFIQSESIEYISASWSSVDVDDDGFTENLNYLIDAISTDLLYGGNKQISKVSEIFYNYTLNLTETENNKISDGISYTQQLADKVLSNVELLPIPLNQENTYQLIKENREIFQSEVISYISSSWSTFDYNSDKCYRDVGYIVDAVATDVRYGGNERSVIAGEYYWKYPSDATVDFQENPNGQLNQTIDGIKHAAGLVQSVIQNIILQTPNQNNFDVWTLIRNNRTLIQKEVTEFIDYKYPFFNYDRVKCQRDTGYIIDAVITDLVWGGNERSVIAGDFYYRYPSDATNTQLDETVDGVRYVQTLYNTIIQNIEINTPRIIYNSENNIKVTDSEVITSSVVLDDLLRNEISQSYEIVTDVINNGIDNLPILTKSIDNRIKTTDATQFTSSINSGSSTESALVTQSVGFINDIIRFGSENIPFAIAKWFDDNLDDVQNLTTASYITASGEFTSASLSESIEIITSSFGQLIDIIDNGTGSIPTIEVNTTNKIKVTNDTQIILANTGSTTEVSKVNTNLNTIQTIVDNGIEATPPIVENSSDVNNLIKVTDIEYNQSGSSGRLQERLVSSSFSLITTILRDGTGSLPDLVEYGDVSEAPNTILAYDLIQNNLDFITSESIAYISSSWSSQNYNSIEYGNDIRLFVSGAIDDMLHNANSSSLSNVINYYDNVSAEDYQTQNRIIDGIEYAGKLSNHILRGRNFETASVNISASVELIRNNKDFIQNETIEFISSSWSDFDYNSDTCRRDVGFILDAVATDLLYGGNQRSVTAGEFYYEYPSAAINGGVPSVDNQKDPTVTALDYVKNFTTEIIDGTVFQTASAESDYVYDIITNNRNFIQAETVAFVNAKYPDLYYSEVSCSRDTGFIVDAIATDFKWGGNQRTLTAGEFYYLYPSKATDEQSIETTDAIVYASDLITKLVLNETLPIPTSSLNTDSRIKITELEPATDSVTNSSNILQTVSSSFSLVSNALLNGFDNTLTASEYGSITTDSDILSAYGIITESVPFIKNEVREYISSSWMDSNYDVVSYGNDIETIILGVADDLRYEVVSQSIVNAEYYSDLQLNQTANQQLIDGINYSNGLSDNIINGVTFEVPTEIISASVDNIRQNREFIQSESIAYLSSSWSGFDYDEIKCKRDIGHIVDAVSTDLLYGGNQRSVLAGDFYYRYPSSATDMQLEPTTTGIKYAGDIISEVLQLNEFITASVDRLAGNQVLLDNREFIENEVVEYISSSWSTFDYDDLKCKRDTGYILNGVATDLLYGGNERSRRNAEFYFEKPSSAIINFQENPNGQLNQTLDGIIYSSRLADEIVQNKTFVTASTDVSASVSLLRSNREFIQKETIAFISSSWSNVTYNEVKCERDTGYIVDAATTDLLYGGNERSTTAGLFYWKYPSRATNAGRPSEQNQLDPTVDGIRFANGTSQNVVLSSDYTTSSLDVINGVQLLRDNTEFIQKETIAYLSSSWSEFDYNEVSCSRDLGYIIDAVATDIKYGGNERAVQAATFYYYIPSIATTEQKPQTTDGIDFSKGLAEKIIQQKQLVFPFVLNREGAQNLKSAKRTLQGKAISYTNAAFPNFDYNEEKCYRDTGFIVDAIATDIIYGGNERSIRAAESYYNGVYGDASVVVNEQKKETAETNRYLRTQFQFVARQAPVEEFGSLIITTGHDFSYAGSGVTYKALPPNQGGDGVPNPDKEIVELDGGRVFFTSGNELGDFRIGGGLVIKQASGTLEGRTFSRSLFSLVTPFSLALQD